MCAIFGIIGPYKKSLALKALATLSHRGPDAKGSLAGPKFFFGHYRLSVIDPSPEADQPMQVSNVTVLLNGEIYNYKELSKELGSKFRTRSDTEAVARAFIRWSEKIPEKIRGMYALAIFHEGVLHLFRDPFGKKPLYWTKVEETFIFSSEIKAILAYFPDMKWSRKRFCSYLSYQSFISPETFYPGIFQLEPGGYLRYENGEIDSFVAKRVFEKKKREIEPGYLEKLLEESVRYRLVSEAPLGALLSGGLDSSLVVAMAQRQLQKPLSVFTVGYEGFEKYDERKFAETVAEYTKSDHKYAVMDLEDFIKAADELAEHLDEPLGDPAAVPLWFLSRRIKESGIKVILSGDGADELFFGYRPYYELSDIEKLDNIKYRNWLRNFFRKNYSYNREWEWYKRIFDGSPLFRSSAELFTDLQQNRLLKQNVKDDRSLENIEHFAARFGMPAGAKWYSYIDIKIQLGEVFLKKLDRVTMAHGIEARSPFMDRILVGELLSCDSRWLMGEEQKWLLKKIARRYLPESIIYRKKKGFSYPYMEWLHKSGELETVNRINEELGLFKKEALDFMMEKSKRNRFRHHLYAIWFLCKWLQKRM